MEHLSEKISSVGFDLFQSGENAAAIRVFRNEMIRVPEASGIWRTMVKLCQERIREKTQGRGVNPQSSRKGGSKDNPALTVTLTTISSRLDHLPAVISSLENQTLSPSKIVLNISQAPHLLDHGISPGHALLRKFQSSSLVHVNWVDNSGPYRKLMPLLRRHVAHRFSEEELFVTVDDDTLYPEDFLDKLFIEYKKHDCVVAFRGRLMCLAEDSGFRPYREWGPGLPTTNMLNLATGKDGVIYSSRFFTPEVADLDAAIRIAPTADDLWWKWHTAMNGVPTVILNPEACTSDYKSFPVVDYSKEYRSNSLYAIHNSGEARGGNDAAVSALESRFFGLYGLTLADFISFC